MSRFKDDGKTAHKLDEIKRIGKIQLFLFDIEMEKSGIFFLAHVFVTGSLAPAGKIVAGTGVGTKDLQNITGTDLIDFFLGAQQGHGAAQSFCVQGFCHFQVIGCLLDVAHGTSRINDVYC